MVADRVDAEADDLAISFLKFRHQSGHITELGCADRSEVLRMGEQDRPPVADPVMEIDSPLRRLRSEVRGLGIDSHRHDALSRHCGRSANLDGTVSPPNRSPLYGSSRARRV